MGNHPLDGADRGRSPMSTLHDYGRFLFDVIDGEGRTAYQKAFPDHWSAEVVYVFDNALRRENTKKVFVAQLPELAASGRVHCSCPTRRSRTSSTRSRGRSAGSSRRAARATARARPQRSRARKPLASPAPTITVELDELRRFFNYDLDLEKAFKAIQRKVQAGEPITEVPQLPMEYERVREFKRQLRARIVALMEHASRIEKDVG